jgi:hypothetical protein
MEGVAEGLREFGDHLVLTGCHAVMLFSRSVCAKWRTVTQ